MEPSLAGTMLAITRELKLARLMLCIICVDPEIE